VRIAVLGNSGSWYCNDIARVAHEAGHQCSRLDFQRIAAECGNLESVYQHVDDSAQSAAVRLEDFDAVIVRTMPPGSLEQVVFRMDALARLESRGTVVINSPKSIECAVDKYLTTARLLERGLPIPPTSVCQDAETALQSFERLGGDVVVKPIFGAEGRGICRVSDPDLAFRTFRTLERTGAVIYLQQFIRHPGYDVRVLILDGRIIGGMKRFGADDFRTNVARSARTEIHETDDAERRLSLEAVAAVDARFAGVDLLYDDSGQCFVIEVNAVPGWQAFTRTTGLDVAKLLIRSLDGS
jgi:ribosomal protein S6--L-glutamate ligase